MTDSDDWAAGLSGPPKKPMKRGTKIFLWLFAALVAWLTLSNATWLAPDPVGKRVLIAHRGVSQLFDHRGVTDDSCTATRIYPPEHAYIENSLPSMKVAIGRDAGAVKFDVAATKDGRLAVFHDWTLDCRTDGKGDIRDRTMAELKRLDIGYGYTADGGKTFPLRGKGVGLMPSLDDVLRDLGHASLIVNFKSRDPREGALALAAFARAGIDPNQPRFGFFGNARGLRPIRDARSRWRQALHRRLYQVRLVGLVSAELRRRHDHGAARLSMGLLGLARPPAGARGGARHPRPDDRRPRRQTGRHGPVARRPAHTDPGQLYRLCVDRRHLQSRPGAPPAPEIDVQPSPIVTPDRVAISPVALIASSLRAKRSNPVRYTLLWIASLRSQ